MIVVIVMLLFSNILLLLVSAVTSRREFTILFNRVAIIILLYSGIIGYDSLYVTYLDTGIGIYNGLFHSTAITHSFDLFIYIIGAIILLLTAFYPRRIEQPIINYNRGESKNRLLSKGYVKGYKNAVMGIDAPQFTILEYPLIILFILIGAILLMSSSDLVSMFLAIELQSYGLYIFATLYRDSEWSTSAGLTYFLLGGLSSCFILLGSALLYASCGLTSLDGIYVFYNIISENGESITSTYPFYAKPEIFNMGFLIMSVGYLFKVSAAPFHFWSPDVYDSLNTLVTTFIANLPKISIIIFLLEIVHHSNLSTADFGWTNIFLISSFLSLVVGTVVGLVQFRIKRLLAYSTISHVGFLLLALAINSIESVQALIFYLMQYSLLNINIFFIIIAIGYSLAANTNLENNAKYELLDSQHSPLQYIDQLKGYYHVNPMLSTSLAISLFSFLGVPPLIGFFAKQSVLSAALQEGYVFLCFVAILTSVIGGVYYLFIVKAVFFDKSDYTFDQKSRNVYLSSALSLPISILTLITLLFILSPTEWLSSANIFALALFNT